MLAISVFLLSFLSSGTASHTIPNITDNGYTAMFAATIFSFLMISQTVGKLVLGAVFDKFGIFIGVLVVSVCVLLFPLFALMIPINPLFAWVFALLMGIGSAGVSVPLNILVSEYFGNRDFAVIFSRLNSVSAIGMAVSATIIGYI